MNMDSVNLNQNSADLYDVIRNKYNKITMTDANGDDTIDETQAVQFDIDDSGTVITISLIDPEAIKVFYDKNKLDNDNTGKWEDLISDLGKFTVGKTLKLDLHPTDRPLNDTDRNKLTMQSKDNVAESRFSKMDGSKRTSFQGLTKVKVKVRHRKPVDENIQGSRSRNVSRIFVETNAGERWIFPFPMLDGARAMARHIEEGGSWNDRVGQHILDLSEKVTTIRKFGRQARTSGVTEAAVPVLVRLGEKLEEYKKKLHLMQGSRGYHSYRTTMAETFVEPVDHFTNMFARVDDDLVKLMPAVERILGERENTNLVTESVSTFVNWINAK